MKTGAVKLMLMLFMAAALMGCSEVSDPQPAVIVHVQEEERGGASDDWTVVELLSDGVRYRKPGQWGAVGDTFMVRMVRPGLHGPHYTEWR